MTRTQFLGLVGGLGLFAAMLLMPTPEGMEPTAQRVAALTLLMAVWWMTQALPLTVTALLPFLIVPFAGVMSAREIANEYYDPILFLILGGAFLALAIERVGLHRRLALALLKLAPPTSTGLLFAFMAATAILSMLISNTSTTLIMVPIALAVLRAGGVEQAETRGFAGAVMMGIAFSASIGGLGTLVGSPTNAIAAGLIERALGLHIGFATWAMYGIPVVALAVPAAMLILQRVQRLKDHPFDGAAASGALGHQAIWSTAERRVVPVVVLVVGLWMLQPLLEPFVPAGSLTDGTIAVAGSLLLFLLPDGTGRPLLVWKEADRAPWGVIMMFGGGLALAAGMQASGLAEWLGQALLPLSNVPLPLVALAIVAMVVLVTEFASNVATASGIIPVVASLIVALGADPILLAMPAAIAASWGFMLPAGTGPNAIAWATGRIRIERMVGAGLALDILGIAMIVGLIWGVASIAG